MVNRGKVRVVFVITVPPDQVDEGKRIFQTGSPWMDRLKSGNGEEVPLSHHMSLIPELSNPIDPGSEPTGKICFILTELYEIEIGAADHFQQAMSGWPDFPNLGKWLDKCQVQSVTWTLIGA